MPITSSTWARAAEKSDLAFTVVLYAEEGGRIIACGSPEEIADSPKSITGKYLRPLK